MKNFPTVCALAMTALLAGNAMAADGTAAATRGKDGPHGIMRADTNGDGKVSKDEAAALHEQLQGDWFDKADTDKDGFLTADEISQARDGRREQRRGDMRARMEERFKEADANTDGQLSLDEVQAKMPRLAERFNALDTDKNGMLSKDELKHGGQHRTPPQG